MRSRRSKKRLVVPAIAAIALVAVACTSGSDSGSSAPGGSGSSGAPIELTMWHGYGKVIDNQGQTNYESKSLTDLVDEYNAMNTGVHVNLDYIGSNDHALEKLTVALNAGEQPDITYQYGTSMPQLATAPGVLDLTDKVQDPSFNWNDFSEGARQAATVDGHVYGIPALIDNLAIVYNKDLFQQAGVAPPTPDWTWDDFAAAAKALTDPSHQQYGFAFPIDASEDTTWHYDAMLWEAGGDILNADNTQAAFNSDAGVEALTALQQMAVTDKSVFLDQQNTGKIDTLFNSGKIAMDVTGPWALSGYPDINYGVADHAGVPRRLPRDDRGAGHVGHVRQRRARRSGVAIHAVADRRRAGQGRLDGKRPPADPQLGRRRARLHQGLRQEVPR
jgi:multiple sugar transport system substrate-binding protein